MTILVTGGAGYIGSHTCVELLSRGMDVVIIDNLRNSSIKAVERIEEITGKKPVFYKEDVRNREALRDIFRRHDISAVIHFAGLKAVGESVRLPLDYYDNNLNSTIVLCQVMEEMGVKKIIFSSSATVYEPGAELPCKEENPTGHCTNPYGWTKYMSEQILRDSSNAYEGWSVVLLRYFNPIGAHPSGLIGEDPRGIPNNLMPYISQVAVGRLPHLNVYGNDYNTHDGTGVRDYIHVVDLARGHVAAIEYAMASSGEAAFNLGTGMGYSVLDLVKAFERVNGIEIPYVIAPRRAGDIDAIYASPDKSAQLLNWRAEYGIDEMCRDTWNWQKNNPAGYEE